MRFGTVGSPIRFCLLLAHRPAHRQQVHVEAAHRKPRDAQLALEAGLREVRLG